MKPYMLKLILSAAGMLLLQQAYASDWDQYTFASNKDSVANTRHNLSFTYMQGQPATGRPGGAADGDQASLSMPWFMGNNYGEVCVYCHTPHGANTTTAHAPLWNHTLNTVTYTTWDTQAGTSWYPGPNSLICLGCHDGSVSLDSVVNMPGSGNYDANNADGTGIDAFLDTWRPWVHYGLATCSSGTSCHTSQFDFPGYEGTDVISPGFETFILGSDLRDDHPVGINFPDTVDFNDPPNEIAGKVKYFGPADSQLNKNDVRIYASGPDFKVECTSCHDPHGVPSAGAGSVFIGGFLRVDNAGSTLCLTCHDK